MLEMAFGLVFLLIIVLIVFEMAMLFYSYIALLNASREGAVYASAHPNMGETELQEYEALTSAEALAAGLLTESEFFQIDPPVAPEGTAPLDPVIVRVHYQLINPTQGIILPMLGRMGLFQSAWISAATEMPYQ
jgi:hypothetical protein